MKPNWQTKKLEEIANIVMGQSPPSSTYNTKGDGLPFFQGKAEFGELYPTVKKWCTKPHRIAEKDDILLSVRAPVGPMNIAPYKSGIGRGLAALRPKDEMPPILLMHMIANSVNKLILKSTGTTFNAIKSADLKNLELKVPPKSQYFKLTQKLNSLFAKIDAGEEKLKKVEEQLEVYRQAVLKKAFADTNWTTQTIKEISTEVRYGSSKKTNTDGTGIPVIRMGNYDSFGKVDFEKLKYLPRDHNEFPELLLQSGDLLFNRTNSAELVGKTMVWRNNLSKASFASYLIRVRFKKGMIPEFFCHYVNSPYGRLWIKKVVSQQVGQANVNGTKLKELSVPTTETKKQQEVVSQITIKFKAIEKMKTLVELEYKKLADLKQSILKKAFEGRLV